MQIKFSKSKCFEDHQKNLKARCSHVALCEHDGQQFAVHHTTSTIRNEEGRLNGCNETLNLYNCLLFSLSPAHPGHHPRKIQTDVIVLLTSHSHPPPHRLHVCVCVALKKTDYYKLFLNTFHSYTNLLPTTILFFVSHQPKLFVVAQ